MLMLSLFLLFLVTTMFLVWTLGAILPPAAAALAVLGAAAAAAAAVGAGIRSISGRGRQIIIIVLSSARRPRGRGRCRRPARRRWPPRRASRGVGTPSRLHRLDSTPRLRLYGTSSGGLLAICAAALLLLLSASFFAALFLCAAAAGNPLVGALDLHVNFLLSVPFLLRLVDNRKISIQQFAVALCCVRRVCGEPWLVARLSISAILQSRLCI